MFFDKIRAYRTAVSRGHGVRALFSLLFDAYSLTEGVETL